MEAKDDVLTVAEVAELLRVKPLTVQRWHARGLPYSKLGTVTRYRRSAVLDWVAANEKRDGDKRERL